MATALSLSGLAAIGRMVVRVVAIALGTYAASAAIMAAGVAALIACGVNRSDAFIACSLVGFALYVALALWAAAVRRLPVLVGWLALLTATGAAIALLPMASIWGR